MKAHSGSRFNALWLVLVAGLIATRIQNEDAKVQIAALTSRTALQRRLKEGYLKMIPITERSIVRLDSSIRPASEDDVQPVANQRGNQ